MAKGDAAPPTRRLIRVLNLDPLGRERLPTTAVLSVLWEPLSPGPIGDRIEVIDFDPVNRCFYKRVDLDDPVVAAQDGLAPHERDPRMHQQMVYAVAARVLESVIESGSGLRLDDPSPLVELAGQFGRSTRQRAALHTALAAPDPSLLAGEADAYKRAAALVAAVFHGLFRTYEEETRRLVVLATNGTGILPPGNVPPALVAAVADETRRISDRLLTICVRAFDYLPPVDLAFGDFIRAVITADADLFPNGRSALRHRLIEGFHRFGIHADGVWSLSESALRLDPAPPGDVGIGVRAKDPQRWTTTIGERWTEVVRVG